MDGVFLSGRPRGKENLSQDGHKGAMLRPGLGPMALRLPEFLAQL